MIVTKNNIYKLHNLLTVIICSNLTLQIKNRSIVIKTHI